MAALLLGLVLAAPAAIGQISLSINVPGVSIGVNVPTYPQLMRVPGYPVYYAPRLASNYFFYDGMYWVYQDDSWYASSWYNGPWGRVDAFDVPVYILRIPVRYYRNPPVYFRGWRADAFPRWGEHWGRDWEQRRRGWDRWNRQSVPAPAPLPIYQRQYRGDRYPDTARQAEIQGRNYHYQPRDQVARQHFAQPVPPRAPAPSEQRAAPPVRDERVPPRQAPPRDMRNPQPPMPQPVPQPMPQPSPRGEAPGQARPHPMPPPVQQQPPQQRAPQAQAPRQPPQHQPPPQQAPQQAPPQQREPHPQGPRQQPPHAPPAAMPAPPHAPPRAAPERQPAHEQPGRAPPSAQRGNPGEHPPERGRGERERN